MVCNPKNLAINLTKRTTFEIVRDLVNSLFKSCYDPNINLVGVVQNSAKTDFDKQAYQCFGFEELRVTDRIFKSKESLVFEQTDNCLHTIKAVTLTILRSYFFGGAYLHE